MVLGAREKNCKNKKFRIPNATIARETLQKKLNWMKKIDKIGTIFNLCYLAIISCLYKASVTRFYLQ